MAIDAIAADFGDLSRAAGAAHWEVVVNGGRIPTGLDLVTWAREIKNARTRARFCSLQMARDGTQAGFDIPMLQAVTTAVSIPVIASGDAGSLAHFLDALTLGGTEEAALAASLFHYKTLSIGQVKAYLADHGVAVR